MSQNWLCFIKRVHIDVPPWEFYRNVQHRTEMIDLQNYIWFISVQGLCLNIYFQYSLLEKDNTQFPCKFPLYGAAAGEPPKSLTRAETPGSRTRKLRCQSRLWLLSHTEYTGFWQLYHFDKKRENFKLNCLAQLLLYSSLSRSTNNKCECRLI